MELYHPHENHITINLWASCRVGPLLRLFLLPPKSIMFAGNIESEDELICEQGISMLWVCRRGVLAVDWGREGDGVKVRGGREGEGVTLILEMDEGSCRLVHCTGMAHLCLTQRSHPLISP